jgi:hypothetical protein
MKVVRKIEPGCEYSLSIRKRNLRNRKSHNLKAQLVPGNESMAVVDFVMCIIERHLF